MVVLCWHYHRQLFSWSCRGNQREYHSSGLGVHCCASTGNFHFAFREYPRRHSFGILLTNIMFQSAILFARFGNGIATNNLSKMLAGLMLPGRPVGNMYFAAWSHNVVTSSVSVSTDLKLGEYLKIPPRIMLWTQMYGIVLGGFINYAILSSIISANRGLLAEGNGNSSWSGATMQAFNTKAASWALAPYLYKLGAKYEMIPIALAVGAVAVIVHRLFYHVSKPKAIHDFSTS